MSDNTPNKSKNKKIPLLAICLGIVIFLSALLIILKACGNDETDTPDTPDIPGTESSDGQSGTEKEPTQDEKVPSDSSDTEKTPEIPADTETLVFAGLSSEKDLRTISLLKGQNVEYTIVYNETIDGFLLSGYEHMLYNESFGKIMTAIVGLKEKGEITDPISDEEYSVSPETCSYTLNVTDKNGNTQTLYIGAQLISGEGYYCKMAGSNKVFYVNHSVAKLFYDNNSLLSTQLQDPLDASRYHYTEEFVLFKDLAPFVKVRFVPEEERESGDAYGYYQMTYPGEYALSDINYDTALKSLICPMADSVVTTEITAENIEKYGFTVPSYEVEYTLDGKTNKLYFGNRTDDGSMIYVMSDYGFIGLAVVKDHFPFLDYELIDFINPYLFGININYISRLTVSAPGFSDRYVLSGSGDALAVTSERDGQAVDTKNFRNFYRDLLMLEMKGYSDKNSSEENWKFSFTIELTGGKIYEYKFYHTAERMCYYTVNGNGEFYVDISAIEKVVSDAVKLSQGEIIDPDAQF